MKNPTSLMGAFRAVATALCFAASTSAVAQFQSGYGSYYTNKVTTGSLATNSSSKYLYDKYFYQRPTVSPYLNTARGGSDIGTSYQAYVRPELQRREANAAASRAYVQQRKLEGRVGETRLPGAGFVGGSIGDARLKPPTNVSINPYPSSYYNHWYGGWKK